MFLRPLYLYFTFWTRLVFNLYCTVQMLSVNVMSFTEAFGTTWTKHYCIYRKDTKEFKMIPYNQMTGKFVSICHTCEL